MTRTQHFVEGGAGNCTRDGPVRHGRPTKTDGVGDTTAATDAPRSLLLLKDTSTGPRAEAFVEELGGRPRVVDIGEEGGDVTRAVAAAA